MAQRRVQRQQRFLQTAFRAQRFNLLPRQRVLEPEHARGGALQRRHVSAAAQRLADVVAQRADIHALAAIHADAISVFASAVKHLNAVHPAFARLQRHSLALSRQLVQPLAVALQRGIHGRYLLDLAHEPRRRRAHILLIRIHGALCHHLTSGVLGIGLHAQLQLGHIGLFLVDDVVEQPCGFADAQRQHAGRLGIQRSAVADGRALGQPSAHEHDQIRRCNTGGLVRNQKAVHRFIPFRINFARAPSSRNPAPAKALPPSEDSTCSPPRGCDRHPRRASQPAAPRPAIPWIAAKT